MKLESSILLKSTRERTWLALNDLEILKACIPGCESLQRNPDGTLNAEVVAKVGPVSARFKGNVHLTDMIAPESYRIVFSGQGGAAGFAKGEAQVRLVESTGGGTQLQYSTEASVGGKLAQIGSRLIEASARKLAEDFFRRFEQEVERTSATIAATPPLVPTVVERRGRSMVWLIPAAIVIGAAVLLLFF